MKIKIAIRDAKSRFYDGLVAVKIFVDGLPVDFSYGLDESRLPTNPDHRGHQTIGPAQREAVCLPGHEKEAAFAAYVLLYEEYGKIVGDAGEEAWCSEYLPYPGEWIFGIPHFQGSEGWSTRKNGGGYADFVEVDA